MMTNQDFYMNVQEALNSSQPVDAEDILEAEEIRKAADDFPELWQCRYPLESRQSG